jgi:hypothetical protein
VAVLVTNVPAPVNWTLRTPAGSVAEYSITLALADNSPYPVDGASWQYVTRISSNSSGAPLFTITTTASDAGLIVVNADDISTVVQLTLYPAATASRAGTYRHSLWMNADTDGAFCWLTGSLVAAPTPQPS